MADRLSYLPPEESGRRSPGVVLIANRGPNEFVWKDGGWMTRPAADGFSQLLLPIARQPHATWVCCVSEPPGATVDRGQLFTTSADQVDASLDILPVPVPAAVYRDYYGRISNEVLFRLQHHLIGPGGYEAVDKKSHDAWEHGYLEANRRLAEVVLATCQAPTAILVQDYHLYPLPALLRAGLSASGSRLRRGPESHPPILHFTHIPFPEVATMRLLPAPWRTAILRGLLGADLVGFQTDADRRAFLGCCHVLLGVRVDEHASMVESEDGRPVRVQKYPTSIDPDALAERMRSPAVEKARRAFLRPKGTHAVVSVDRIDPSKNQLAGLRAFGRLLEMRKDLEMVTRYHLFLVPSRTDDGIYAAYKGAIMDLSHALNTRFKNSSGEGPVEVFYTSDREQALAALETCDVFLSNALEDGMNLVVKEWALVSTRPGVLVVSETAGVAEDARGSALTVCPMDIEGTAQALARAIDLSDDERANRLRELREQVEGWTAAHWVAAQLEDLGVDG